MTEQCDEVYEGEDGHMMMMIKLLLGKEEREKQKPRRSRQMYQIGFCFATQDTIEGVSIFRIDSRTMKRKILWLSDLSIATR